MSDTNRLDEVFTKRKITNRVIAKYLKKSEGTISKWRNNKRQPSVHELNKIAELLREDIRNLLYKSDWSECKNPTYSEFKKQLKTNNEK